MQTECRASSLLERFVEVQPILCKVNKISRLSHSYNKKCKLGYSLIYYLSFSIAFMSCLLLISFLMSAIVAFISAICSLHISFLTSKRMRHANKEIKAITKVNPIILFVAVDPFK